MVRYHQRTGFEERSKERGAHDMSVYVKTHELAADIAAIGFTGSLTLDNQLTDIEYAIRERIVQGLRKLVLDFGELNYIDSAGIGIIAVCVGLMERAGGRLVVVGAEGQVKQLLALTHLDRLLEFYPDLPSAHIALARPPAPPA
jgi:anti-sigma B factor antagonist